MRPVRSIRLKTAIWVSALLRRAECGGAYACVLRKGDVDAGSILIKVCTLDGLARLFYPQQGMDGQRIWWHTNLKAEAHIDQLMAQRYNIDPDLWWLEISDRQGRHFIEETVMDQN